MRRPRIGVVITKLFRVLRYGTLASMPVGLLTFVKVYGYRWWMVVVFVPIFIFAWWKDPNIHSGELEYTNENNKDWQLMKDDIKAIKKLLEERNGNLG